MKNQDNAINPLSEYIREGYEIDARLAESAADLYTEIAAFATTNGNTETADRCVEQAITLRNQAQDLYIRASQPITITEVDEEEEEESGDEAPCWNCGGFCRGLEACMTREEYEASISQDNHDCTLSPEDGCDCVKEGYARD